MVETSKTTHRRLSAVRSKNTKPEIVVRRFLHSNGFRFRLNKAKLPGKPDIVLAKHNTIIFVHGCFWHRHKGCERSSIPKKNIKFWNEKFENNVRRDLKNIDQLKKMGWLVLIIWECEVISKEYIKKLNSTLTINKIID